MISFTIVISAVAISFLIALFWLAIINYSTNFLEWKNNNIFSLAIGGIAVVGIAGILEFILLEDKYLFSSNILETNHLLENSLLFYVVIAALIEESLKGIVIWWGIKKVVVKKAKDGMIIGMIIGLSFAVAENGIYFATQIDSSSIGEVFNLIIARTIFSSIAHMVFSGILGFFIARGGYCQRNLDKILLILLGLFFSVLIHTIFNASVAIGASYWLPVVIIVMGGTGVLFILRR